MPALRVAPGPCSGAGLGGGPELPLTPRPPLQTEGLRREAPRAQVTWVEAACGVQDGECRDFRGNWERGRRGGVPALIPGSAPPTQAFRPGERGAGWLDPGVPSLVKRSCPWCFSPACGVSSPPVPYRIHMGVWSTPLQQGGCVCPKCMRLGLGPRDA